MDDGLFESKIEMKNFLIVIQMIDLYLNSNND